MRLKVTPCHHYISIDCLYQFRIYILNNHFLHLGSLPKNSGFLQGFLSDTKRLLILLPHFWILRFFVLNAVFQLIWLFLTFRIFCYYVRLFACVSAWSFPSMSLCRLVFLSLFYGQFVSIFFYPEMRVFSEKWTLETKHYLILQNFRKSGKNVHVVIKIALMF